MARDLLFVSSFGEGKSREIALAHFTDESEQRRPAHAARAGLGR
jgi:hypothetical protein